MSQIHKEVGWIILENTLHICYFVLVNAFPDQESKLVRFFTEENGELRLDLAKSSYGSGVFQFKSFWLGTYYRSRCNWAYYSLLRKIHYVALNLDFIS